MYSTGLSLALVALLVGGVAMTAWLTGGRGGNAWRNTALAAGLVADVVVTLAAVWHLVAEHGAGTPEPMAIGQFVAAHPAVVVIAIAANVVLAGAIVGPRRLQ